MTSPTKPETDVVRIAKSMDWECLLGYGSGSCVASHGCEGVTQGDLEEFARRLLESQCAALQTAREEGCKAGIAAAAKVYDQFADDALFEPAEIQEEIRALQPETVLKGYGK